MNISTTGLQIITASESFRSEAYYDNAGKKWTIGYGHTATAKQGMTITHDKGVELLKTDITVKEDCITRNFLKKGVLLTQNQFDALVSLSYNMGCAGFLKTDVAKALQKSPPDYEAAAAAFGKYNKAKGKVLDGLTIRRKAEESLFRNDSTRQELLAWMLSALNNPVTLPDSTRVATVKKTGLPETAAKPDVGIPAWVWWAAGGAAAVGGGVFLWKKGITS